MPELLLVQTAFVYLSAALRLLDDARANIPAAHVDAALRSLQAQSETRGLSLDWSRELDFSALDRVAEELFASGGQLPPCRADH